ncbi:MAG TPA: pyruvate kinase [Thermomicrobiales bacterium]|nr:pyruvate kinase [Thermomicrobiales bacterium]
MGVILGRRVKIVATLGPAVSDRDTLRNILRAGVDVARINAAHGSPEVRAQLIADVRAAAADLDRRVPILFDLQGLKIRTGSLTSGKDPVPIARGSTVEVFPDAIPTTEQRIGIGYPRLLEVVEPQSRILISDGLIELLVERVEDGRLVCNVGRGGQLFGRQGVTLPGAPIRGGAITETDRADIAFALEQRVEYLGLSFVNDASDLIAARQATSSGGAEAPGLIAKIERGEALANVREIAEEADGLMVARGDLGVQLPPERVPRAQKEIIGVANSLGLPVITATQMLESMITQPVATRAETSDVANAVWDGTDAVMLSAETAMGRYPVEAVQTMDRIIREIEKDGAIRSPAAARSLPATDEPQLAFADAIARAAYTLSDQTPATLIMVFTLAGSAARRVAKYRPGQQIIAVCTEASVASRLQLVWGVRSIVLPLEEEPDAMFRIAGRAIIDAGLGGSDEYALIVGSLPMLRISGRTNLVHVRKLGT